MTEMRNTVRDIMLIALTALFFLLSVAYVRFCDRVK